MHPELAPLIEGVRLDFADAATARAFTRAVLAEVNRSRTQGAPSVSTRDVVVARDGEPELPIRVYRPQSAQERTAVVLYLHGGGFILGDLDHDHLACLRLAHDAGCVVVSVDYRLAPEDPFPAGVNDCYAALAWTAARADELGIDPSRLAVGGSSAGGGLAACLALMARDRGGPPIALQFLLYPMLDDRMETESMREFAEVDAWNGTVTGQCWQHYVGGRTEVSPYAAAARAQDLRGLPAAYVLVAQLDALRDEGLCYALRLMEAGVVTELHCFADVPHGFDIRAPEAAVSRRANEEVARAIRRALHVV